MTKCQTLIKLHILFLKQINVFEFVFELTTNYLKTSVLNFIKMSKCFVLSYNGQRNIMFVENNMFTNRTSL